MSSLCLILWIEKPNINLCIHSIKYLWKPNLQVFKSNHVIHSVCGFRFVLVFGLLDLMLKDLILAFTLSYFGFQRKLTWLQECSQRWSLCGAGNLMLKLHMLLSHPKIFSPYMTTLNAWSTEETSQLVEHFAKDAIPSIYECLCRNDSLLLANAKRSSVPSFVQSLELTSKTPSRVMRLSVSPKWRTLTMGAAVAKWCEFIWVSLMNIVSYLITFGSFWPSFW